MNSYSTKTTTLKASFGMIGSPCPWRWWSIISVSPPLCILETARLNEYMCSAILAILWATSETLHTFPMYAGAANVWGMPTQQCRVEPVEQAAWCQTALYICNAHTFTISHLTSHNSLMCPNQCSPNGVRKSSLWSAKAPVV